MKRSRFLILELLILSISLLFFSGSVLAKVRYAENSEKDP